MKEKGLFSDFWENFEEYLCAIALLIMTFVTFMNVFSRLSNSRSSVYLFASSSSSFS